MMKFMPVLLLLGASVVPAAAAVPDTIECTAAVTRDIGPRQTLRDLDPSILPVLGYGAAPQPREFKPVTRLGETPVGLYVYRVNEAIAHMQLFEYGAGPKQVLADTALGGPVTELTYRPLGGDDLITAYCFR